MSNLSAGVQILIDQLKENPDAFFGPLRYDAREGYISPKFGGWRQVIEEEIIGIDSGKDRVRRPLPHTWFMSEDEKEALADTYLLAKRQRFDAEIIYTLSVEPETTTSVYVGTQNISTTGYREAMRLDSSGSLGIGATGSAYTSNLAASLKRTKEAVANAVLQHGSNGMAVRLTEES